MFPIDPQPIIYPWTTIEVHGFATNALFMVEHTGTHIDAPSHFISNRKSIDGISLERFRGKARLLDLTNFGERMLIKSTDIKQAENRNKITRNEIVLIRTDWDRYWKRERYVKSNPGLSADAAQYLAKKRVKMVGIDTPNVDHPDSKFPAHRILLGADIPIIENLANLNKITQATFEFAAIPLKIEKGTGSPVRAVAILE
jgi:kynurenine formamidase